MCISFTLYCFCLYLLFKLLSIVLSICSTLTKEVMSKSNNSYCGFIFLYSSVMFVFHVLGFTIFGSLHFFVHTQVPFWNCISSVLQTFKNISYNPGFLLTNSLNFCLSKSFRFVFILEDNFAGCQIPGWCIFL